MKTVDIKEAVTTATAIPIVKKMTRAEKLNHWASLLRGIPCQQMRLYTGLEYLSSEGLRWLIIREGQGTAFSIAVTDPVLREQGLQNPTDMHTLLGFFEISQNDVHMFGCDCEGAISNETTASRIEALARGENMRTGGDVTSFGSQYSPLGAVGSVGFGRIRFHIFG